MYSNQWRRTTTNSIFTKRTYSIITATRATTATTTTNSTIQRNLRLQQYHRPLPYRYTNQKHHPHPQYPTIRGLSHSNDHNGDHSWHSVYQGYVDYTAERNSKVNQPSSNNQHKSNTDNNIYYYYKTSNIYDSMPATGALPDNVDSNNDPGNGTRNQPQQQQQQQKKKKVMMKKAEDPKKKAFARQYTDPDTGMVIIEEGSCSMCVDAAEMNEVFYNPVQVQNRDLSILMLQLYHERRQQKMKEEFDAYMIRRKELILLKKEYERKLQQEKDEKEQGTTLSNLDSTMDMEQTVAPTTATTTPTADIPTTTNNDIHTGSNSNPNTEPSFGNEDDDVVIEVPKVQLQVLDALAASGLRSLRYWKECSEFISHLTINDLDPVAGQRARRNVERNHLSDVIIPDTQPLGRPHGIRITTQDATNIMYNSRTRRFKGKHPNIFPSLAHLHVHPKDRPPPPTPVPLTPEQESERHWDVIDIDPYGSAATFIDAAVQSITHGGLLNITCTDLRTMCGSQTPETALTRYGALPLKSVGYIHDFAIRMLLYLIATTAGRYGRSMKPILSVGMDFYIRVFVEIYDDKRAVQDLPSQVGMVYQSSQCPSFYTLPLATESARHKYQTSRLPSGVCTETGAPLKVGGPIWLGPLHDQDVLQNALQRLKGLSERSGTITKKLPQQGSQANVEASAMHQASSSSATKSLEYIATKDRLHGLLTSCLDELPDVPLYYMIDIISSAVNIPVPPIFEIKSALVNAGYRVSGHHREPLAIKTNAPSSVLWDVMRGWVKRRPMDKPPTPGSLAETIFSVEPSFEVNFSRPWTIQQTKDTFANAKRFPGNPERNWGPKPKAVHGQKRKSTEDEEE